MCCFEVLKQRKTQNIYKKRIGVFFYRMLTFKENYLNKKHLASNVRMRYYSIYTDSLRKTGDLSLIVSLFGVPHHPLDKTS